MGTLLIIGSGDIAYREYALASIAVRNTIVLLQSQPVTWQQKYVADVHQMPLADIDAVIAAAHTLAQRHTFAGILTYDEMAVELTAVVAEALDLPFIDRECARRCRDKFAMREAFEHAGVPSAASRWVTTLDEAAAEADTIGYPVVLKPRAMAGSIGVVRVESPETLAAGYATVTGAHHPRIPNCEGVLVEEYLDGPEVSVESIVVDERPQILAITRKQLGFAPHFEELGHCISAAEPLPETDALTDVVVQAHQSLGIRIGATHAELRLTSRGPRMIEIAARLGGDLIPFLVYLATGIDMAASAADVATGITANIEATRHVAAAIRFLYPPMDSSVRTLSFDPALERFDWVKRARWEIQPGTELRLPPRGFLSRLGYIVVTGATCAECMVRLDQAQPLARAELEPLGARQGFRTAALGEE